MSLSEPTTPKVTNITLITLTSPYKRYCSCRGSSEILISTRSYYLGWMWPHNEQYPNLITTGKILYKILKLKYGKKVCTPFFGGKSWCNKIKMWQSAMETYLLYKSCTDYLHDLYEASHASFVITEEMKNSRRRKHQILSNEETVTFLFQMNTWNKHVCHISVMFSTWFSFVWEWTSALLIMSSHCVLFFCNVLMALSWGINTS